MVVSTNMAEQLQQFESLITQLMSSSNDTRNPAEAQYDTIEDVTKIHFLLQIIGKSAIPEVRQMAAVLLRRIFATTVDFIKKLDDNAMMAVKADLLRGIQEEQNPAVRRKICDVASELAKSLLDEEGYNHWQELLKFLFECCNSNRPELKESALHIFCSFPGVFGNQQDHYLNVIKQMLYQCLNDQTSREVRFIAARALCAFITDQVSDAKQRQFAELIPGIIQVVRESAQSNGDDTVLKSGLIELAENCPKLLRPSLEPLITLLLEIIGNSDIGENWRHLSVECIVTLAESAPAMVRKVQKFIPLIIPQLLAMMVDLEDDPEWSKCDEIEDEDYESNSVVGESSLDRLACGLGGKTILPHITATIPQMLSNADWRYRHAGLMAISAVGEGCQKQMEMLLMDVTNVVLPFLNDSHPRVRYACCNAIGQMSTDFANGFQRKFHMKSDSYVQRIERDIEARSRSMKDKLQGKNVVKQKREEWMTELPPEMGKNFGLGPRTFRRQAVELGDRSVWTDTPADKARKLAGNSSKSSADETSYKTPWEEEREKHMEQMIKEYNKTNRGESLLEKHQNKIKKQKQEEGMKPNERRPFDRDKDLANPLMDPSKRKSLINKSQELGSRFSHSKSGSSYL